MSQRTDGQQHVPDGSGPGPGGQLAPAPIPASDPILDAAERQVMAVGVRRTTLTDVAKRAGVSRMTVYRRYPDVTTLVQALMTRAFSAVIERAATEAGAGGNGRERVVRTAVHGAELLSAHPLFLRIIDVDPELLLPYATQRTGHFQALAIDALAAQLQSAIADGSVRAADARQLAATIELALRGVVLAARDEAVTGRHEQLFAELSHMLDCYLRPRETP